MKPSADLPSAMAGWIASTPHSRPFFRDTGFIGAFGRPGPTMLRQAVDELWRRADFAAYRAAHPITLPPRLGGAHPERN